MKRYAVLGTLVIVAAVLLAAPAFSQETKESAAPEMATEQAPVAATEPAVPVVAAPAAEAPLASAAPEEEQSKDISIYGEVLAVNGTGSTLTVQYYDYDSDEEKTVELTVSGDTKLENTASLTDVKKGDWVDAAYAVINGKNAAKAIMVEKEEAAASDTTAPASDTTAADQQ